MNAIAFFVPGIPVTQGSDCIQRGRYVNPHRLVAWRNKVKLTARGGGIPPSWDMAAAMHVKAVFIFERPKSHYRTGKNASLLRDATPTGHVYKPDIDKLLRAAMDSLTKTLWNDDAQVREVLISKCWQDEKEAEGRGAGMFIRILQ